MGSRFRLRAGLTQDGLAERSKLGVRTVRGLGTGERVDPRVGTVEALAGALGVLAIVKEVMKVIGEQSQSGDPEHATTVVR